MFSRMMASASIGTSQKLPASSYSLMPSGGEIPSHFNPLHPFVNLEEGTVVMACVCLTPVMSHPVGSVVRPRCRAVLGKQVFADPAALHRLEGIVWPWIRQEMFQAIEAAPTEVCGSTVMRGPEQHPPPSPRRACVQSPIRSTAHVRHGVHSKTHTCRCSRA